MATTPNWLKYIADRNKKTVKEAETYIQNTHFKSYKTKGFGFYKMLLKEEKLKPIGSCGLVKRDELEHVDIGFAFLPEYEGKGFGYESSVEIIKLAKENFKLDILQAMTVPYNFNSIKLLEKLGFTYEKRIKPFEDDEELMLFAKNL